MAASMVQNAARCWRQTSQVIPLRRGRRVVCAVVAFLAPCLGPFVVAFIVPFIVRFAVLILPSVGGLVKVLMPPPSRCRTPGPGPGRWE
ncbi:hypothetical protein GCM10010269_70880 [Streptomyces humidus]|uniref:Uncharacterized protein n=1 Tax=Streptomyces humidus TaxID=52259 RepID=A0A918G7S6_9ACTN|nr:hypothetical protein GCM10010269_70880 [Streptomyces humidus]